MQMRTDISFLRLWKVGLATICLLTISRLTDFPIVISTKIAVHLFRAHDGSPQTPLRHHENATRHKKQFVTLFFADWKVDMLCTSSLKEPLRHIRETPDDLHGQMCCFSQLGALTGTEGTLVTEQSN